MLSRTLRINLSRDFKSIAVKNRFETTNFKYYWEKTTNPIAKVGIALSKNYLKKAVDRNQAKRKTSHLIEELYSDLPKGLNLIIMPKTKVLDLEFEELKKEILSVKRIFA